MELKEFVTQALVQLVKGVQEANSELAGENTPSADKKAFLLAYSGGENPMGPHVEFDVAITIKTEGKATAGAAAKLYVVSFEAGGSKSTVKENISRVRFSVFIKDHQG